MDKRPLIAPMLAGISQAGKKITQADVNNYLTKGGYDKKLYLSGGVCKICGEEYRESKLDNIFCSYTMFVPSCFCDNPREKNRNRGIMISTGIPKKFIDVNYSSIDYNRISETNKSAIQAVTKTYIKEKIYEHRGCLMYGDVGTGKTMMASLIIKHLAIIERKKCLYIKMANLISEIINSDWNYLNTISKYDVIFLDDIDKTGDDDKVSSFVQEKRFSLFDWIYGEEKILIATTNVQNLESLKTKYSSEILSRIRGICEEILFEGADYRPIEKENKQ